MIYFIQQGDSGPIKIGYTKDRIRQRIKSLQVGSAEPLILLGATEGDKNTEAILHGFFNSDKMNGEWFKPSVRLMNYILSLAIGYNFTEDFICDDLDATLWKIEKTFIKRALDRYNGNKTIAAKSLGISFRSIRHRIAKYGL